MQKKVLIPLLMAPAAVPALANVNIDFPENSHWTQNGATGDQNPWSSFDPNATEVTCTVGTGYITTTLELPAGKYKMYFVNQRNIYVKVDGETLKMNATGNYVEFQIKGNEGAEMEIGAVDKSKGFEFSGKSMELVFNADAQVKDLQTKLAALKDIALEQVNENDLFEEANNLNTRKGKILNKLENYSSETVPSTSFETVWENIAKIDYATISFKDALDIYTKYGFNETPNAIDAYLTALGKEIDSYNKAVINETGVFALYQENLETRTALLKEQAELAAANDALLKEITDWTLDDSEKKASILEKVQAQATALAKYKAEIETAFPYVEGDWEYNRSLCEKITFNPTPNAEALTETNKTLQEEYNKFKADYEVYYQVNFQLLTDLNNAYDNYANVLGQASGVRGFENVYDDIREKGFDELYLSEDAALKAYNDAKATYQIPEVTGAVETATKKNCVDGLTKAINNFKMLSEALAELVETQNNNMTAAQNTYSEYTTAIANFKKMVVVDTYRAEFDRKLGVIETDVNAFQT